MTARVLVDTGPLFAIFSVRDRHHEQCLEQLGALPKPLLTCWPVLTETAWLMRDNLMLVERLLAACASDGSLRALELDNGAPPWISGFLRRYSKLRPSLLMRPWSTWPNARGLKPCSPWTAATSLFIA